MLVTRTNTRIGALSSYFVRVRVAIKVKSGESTGCWFLPPPPRLKCRFDNPMTGSGSNSSLVRSGLTPAAGLRPNAPESMHFHRDSGVAGGLLIYRAYKHGAVLAGLRSVLQWANPGNARNQGQQWVDIRYIDDWTWRTLLPDGWIRAHGMHKLACYMNDHLPPDERYRPVETPQGSQSGNAQ